MNIQLLNRASRILVVSVVVFAQLFSFNGFAADPIGGSNLPNQPTCTLGTCTASQSQNSQTSSDFFAPSALSQPSQTFRIHQGESIQSAINQASEGDTIEIEAGKYTENLNFVTSSGIKKNLTLIGINSYDDSRPVLTSNLLLVDGTTLKNLVFARDNSSVVLSASNATGVKIDSVKVSGYISLGGNGNTITGSTIETANLGQFSGTPSLTVTGGNNLIYKNVISSANLYVMRVYSGTIGGNVIDGNTLVGKSGITTDGLIVNRTSDALGKADTIVNTLISQTNRSVFSSGAVTNISYSLLQSGSNSGNLAMGAGLLLGVDPKFINAAGGDYHLQENSPAVNVGDPNSPKDADGTRADIGALEVTRIIDTVYLATVGESRENLDDFMELLSQRGIDWISRAEVQALLPQLASNQTFTPRFILTRSGTEVFVAITGNRDTLSCIVVPPYGVNQCSVSQRIPTGVGMYKATPSSAGVRINAHSALLPTNVGFTVDGDLYIAPDYLSATIYDNAGRLKAYVRNAVQPVLDGVNVAGPQYAWSQTNGTVRRINTNQLQISFSKAGVAESANGIIAPPLNAADFSSIEIRIYSDKTAELNIVILGQGVPGGNLTPFGSNIVTVKPGLQIITIPVPKGVQNFQGLNISEASTNPALNLILDYAVFLYNPVPAGWTRAKSNPGFAFQVRPVVNNGVGGNSALYLLDLKTSKEYLIQEGSSVRFSPASYDISADGKNIVSAFIDSGPPVGISTVNIYATNFVTGTMTRVYSINAKAESITLSPGKVTVTGVVNGVPSGTARKTFEISLADPTKPVLLSEKLIVPQGWTQAKSNEGFAFQVRSASFPGNSALYLLDLKTSKEYLIQEGSSVRFSPASYDISADGKNIVSAFIDSGPPVGISTVSIYATNFVTGAMTRVYSSNAKAEGITLSPGKVKIIALVSDSSSSTGTSRKSFEISLADPAKPVLIGTTSLNESGAVTQTITYAYHANGAYSRIVTRNYTNGIVTSATVVDLDPNGVTTHRADYTFYSNGIVKTSADYTYSAGRLSVAVSYLQDTYGRATAVYQDFYDAAGSSVVQRNYWQYTNGVLMVYSETRYSNRVAVSARTIVYAGGQVDYVIEDTFYSNGVIYTRRVVDYNNGVLLSVSDLTQNAQGQPVQTVAHTFYASGVPSSATIVNYSNGVAVSQGYYLFYPNGALAQYYVWSPQSGWRRIV